MVTKILERNAPGTVVTRLARAIAMSKDMLGAAAIAKQWLDLPQLSHAFDIEKAAVSAGSLSDDTWAASLASAGVVKEVVELLRERSILEMLIPRMRPAPAELAIPRETTASGIGWIVREGAATPIARLTFDNVRLSAQRIAALVVLSKELLQHSGAEVTVRDILLATLAATEDRLFLDPSSPSSVTSTGTEVMSTGSDASSILTDLLSMISAIGTPATSLTWILSRKVAAKLSLLLGASAGDLPRTLGAAPVILNGNAGNQITLLDVGEVLLAADPNGYALSKSEHSSLELSSAPIGSAIEIGTSVEVQPAALTSLWQSNLVGLLQSRYLSWLPAHHGCCAWMSAAF